MSDSRESAKSVEKALAILTSFSSLERSLGITELSKRLGFSKAATHRLVVALESRGFLVQTEDSRYAIGPTAFRVGSLYKKVDAFIGRADSALRKLRDRTGCTVQLCVLDKNELMVISSYEGSSYVRVVSTTGTKLPVIGTASGMSILASMNDAASDAWIASAALKKEAREMLDRQLAEVREKGYASSNSVLSDQLLVFSIGVPPELTVEHYALAVIVLENMLTPQLRSLMHCELMRMREPGGGGRDRRRPER